MSNNYPLKLTDKSVPFHVQIELFNSSGNKVISLSKKIEPGKKLKLCFQDFIKNSSNRIETYFAKVLRKGIKKGIKIITCKGSECIVYQISFR